MATTERRTITTYGIRLPDGSVSLRARQWESMDDYKSRVYSEVRSTPGSEMVYRTVVTTSTVSEWTRMVPSTGV